MTRVSELDTGLKTSRGTKNLTRVSNLDSTLKTWPCSCVTKSSSRAMIQGKGVPGWYPPSKLCTCRRSRCRHTPERRCTQLPTHSPRQTLRWGGMQCMSQPPPSCSCWPGTPHTRSSQIQCWRWLSPLHTRCSCRRHEQSCSFLHARTASFQHQGSLQVMRCSNLTRESKLDPGFKT